MGITPLNILEYELYDNLSSLKSASTWSYIFAFFALYFAILGNFRATVLFIVLIFGIEIYKDYKSGRVAAYIRKKKGIPSKTEIKKMKDKYIQENGGQA